MDLKKIMEHETSVDLEFTCHDCNQPVRVTATDETEEGIILTPQDGAAGYYPELATGEREYFVKCSACYEKNPQLSHYNPSEVYTRVVGYYRPVRAFNVGKKAEYKDRKEFLL